MNNLFQEWVLKHGVTGVLFVIIFIMRTDYSELNNRIVKLEEKLYQCYELRINENRSDLFKNTSEESVIKSELIVGILPDKIKIKNENNKRYS